RRNDKDLVDRQSFGEQPVEPDIGEYPAGKTETARLVPLNEPRDCCPDVFFEKRLNRGRGILAGLAPGKRMKALAQCRKIGEVHLEAGIVGDAEVALHLGKQRWLAKGGEPGQFALMAGDLPAERLGDKAVGEPQAAVGALPSEPAVVTIEVGERAI